MKKILAFAATALVLTAGITAQDFDSFDSFDSFGGDTGSSSSASTGFTFGADATLDARYYVDYNHNNNIDVPTKVLPKVILKAGYEGSSTEFNVNVKLDEDTLKNYQMDILDEFQAKLFAGDWVLSAGKMRVVWGKGDKVHVMDNFNANDYTNFIVPDYLDRRIAEYMLDITYNAPCGLTLEGIYCPVMTGERYASSGQWKPGKVTKLENVVKQVEGFKVLTANGTDLANAAPDKQKLTPGVLSQLVASSKVSADDLYPDTNNLEYGQFGVRATGAIGQVNVGASYYFGRIKQVSVDYSGYMASIRAIGTAMSNPYNTYSIVNPKLNYDKVQVFGLEAETVAGPFGLRAEACYNMTEDTEGKARYMRNNSIGYLAGFDVNLPIHNVSLNVQEYGNVVLNADRIRDDKMAQYDADYDPTGCYTNNKLVVDLSDTFNYEKVKVDLKFIYGFERADLIFLPSLTYKIRDSWEANLSGLVIVCQDGKSEFYDWRNNGFVQVGAKYTF